MGRLDDRLDVFELAEEVRVLDTTAAVWSVTAWATDSVETWPSWAATVTSLGSRCARNVASTWRYSGWTDSATTTWPNRRVIVERHQHGLGRGRAAVVEAGVRDIQAGQLSHQRLILERRLERALAGLGLVGRVGRVELAAAGQLIDDRRDEVVVAAAAQEADSLVGALVEREGLATLDVSSSSDSAGGIASGRLAAVPRGSCRRAGRATSSPIALSMTRTSSGVFAM